MGDYINAEQYKQLTGLDAPADFNALLAQAQIIIDRLIGYVEVETLPAKAKQIVQKATAFEVCHLDEVGGLSGASADSVSLGKYSYSSSPSESKTSSEVGPGVQDILYPTGLLYRGCSVS